MTYDRDMEKVLKTRFAPTPSGYLHFGNFCNLILTYWFAKKNDAKFVLRIDDYDKSRNQMKYIEDIFRVLDQLKINFDEGPSSVEDFHKNFSQILFFSDYWNKLREIKHQYNCTCTRKDYQDQAIYPRNCLEKKRVFEKHKSQIRYNVFDGNELFYSRIGDFVLWRKEDIPSYQLVSVLEDSAMGITHIIRGQDLYFSSLAQNYLAQIEKIEFPFLKHIFHHKLITKGEIKLSKSQNAPKLMDELSHPQGPEKLVFKFCKHFGLPELTMDELLNFDLPAGILTPTV